MKSLVFILCCCFSAILYAQDNTEVKEEFIPIEVEGKEAYISTKTGEYTYREHSKTDPTKLKTTPSGVIYTDITYHTVKKGDKFSTIAKQHNTSVAEIKRYNDNLSKLSIGSTIKIVKNMLINSSKPVRGQSGEERIIASLRPGENPAKLATPPPIAEIQKNTAKTKTEKTLEKPNKPTYKVKKDIKNPVFGLNKSEKEQDDTKVEKLINKPSLKQKESVSQKSIKPNKPVKTLKKPIKEVEEKHVFSNKTKIEEPKQAIKKTAETKTERIVSKAKPVLKEKTATTEVKKKTIVFSNRTKKETVKPIAKTSKKNTVQYSYTIKKGDTLYSIAKKYNMTVDQIKELNNLTSNTISVGQKIKIIPQ